jgi:tetratricopeptide (TPR) repeat protein
VTGRAILIALSSISLCLFAVEASAQPASFWADSIRPGVAEAESLRRNLRALIAAQVDRATLLLALPIADRAARLSPDDPEIVYLRARILYDLERWREAVEALEPLITAAPRAPLVTEIALVLGVALTRLDRFADAAAAYRVFLDEEVWPLRRAIALTNLAETHIAQEQLQLALDCFREALATDATYSLAYFGMAVALDRLGEQGRAREVMLQGLTVGMGLSELSNPDVFYVPQWEIHYYRALAQEALGQPDRALEEWQAFLEGGGDDGPYAETVRGHLRRLSQ